MPITVIQISDNNDDAFWRWIAGVPESHGQFASNETNVAAGNLVSGSAQRYCSGLRFRSVNVPQGASIEAATISLFAFSDAVSGSGSEGSLVRVTTGAATAIGYMDVHLGVELVN